MSIMDFFCTRAMPAALIAVIMPITALAFLRVAPRSIGKGPSFAGSWFRYGYEPETLL